MITNQAQIPEMMVITKKTVDYLSERFMGSYKIVDLTWFNQHDDSIYHIEEDYVVAVDVADPPYFLAEKSKWMREIRKPVVFVGPPTNEFPCVVPFQDGKDLDRKNHLLKLLVISFLYLLTENLMIIEQYISIS